MNSKRNTLMTALGVALVIACLIVAWGIGTGRPDDHTQATGGPNADAEAGRDGGGAAVSALDDSVSSREEPDGSLVQTVDADLEASSRTFDRELASEGQGTVEDRLWRRVVDLTKERLASGEETQVIRGRVEFWDRLREADPAARIRVVARPARDLHEVSQSAIVDGAYSLGELPPGDYMVYLEESESLPGIMRHTITVGQGQRVPPLDFALGACSVNARVLDSDGSPLNSEEVEMVVGGTDDSLHTFKTQTGLTGGLWRVDGMLAGKTVIRARIGDRTAGGVYDLFPGKMAEIEIQIPESPPETATLTQ